jgi:hypothetical protein
MEILDAAKWGQLVMTWSTGQSHLPNGYLPDRLPRDLADFDAQCKAAAGLPGADANPLVRLPPETRAIAFVQYSPETVVVKLPPAATIEAAQGRLGSGSYPIPHFYNDAYRQPLEMTDPDLKKKFQAERIGDYAISSCK